MRYYLRDSTLIIRGDFFACSSGTAGGIRRVTSLLNHTVPHSFTTKDPVRDVSLLARQNGLDPEQTFGLLTAVGMEHLCILKHGNIDVFVTAGVTNPDPVHPGEETTPGPGTINIIVLIHDGLSGQALIDGVITATEAKTAALHRLGYPFAGTTTDAVIIAADREGDVRYAGSATPLGLRIHDAVSEGVARSLGYGAEGFARGPFFFIKSSLGSDHWFAWDPQGCPYYPCHFPGQCCDFCYCPLYPCGDEHLGEWISRSDGNGVVWNCTSCTLNHEPVIVSHLKRNPEASLAELLSLRSRSAP
jgi:adenosylcobinamide hydrolase